MLRTGIARIITWLIRVTKDTNCQVFLIFHLLYCRQRAIWEACKTKPNLSDLKRFADVSRAQVLSRVRGLGSEVSGSTVWGSRVLRFGLWGLGLTIHGLGFELKPGNPKP